MAKRKTNPVLKKAWDLYGEGLDIHDAVWEAHGVVCVKHAYLEILGARAGIEFSEPTVIHQDFGKKEVVICVKGQVKNASNGVVRTEWSFGECAPSNNKNNYPYAMAEKRAKDRVILKLIGIHGFCYSESEADEFKESRPGGVQPVEIDEPAAVSQPEPVVASTNEVCKQIFEIDTEEGLKAFYKKLNLDDYSEEGKLEITQCFRDRKAVILSEGGSD